MGSCYNCGTQVTLKEEDIKCDVCGETLRYWCNNCKEPFDVINEETKEKLKECSVCGFFYCPNCRICSDSCEKGNWISEIKKIFGEKQLVLYEEDTLIKLVKLIEEIKVGKERRTCEFGVPITYAKNRIKSLLVRMRGYRVKNLNDQQAFEKRYEDVMDKDIGATMTISQIREDGTYGQEYRDAFNLAICLGKLKATIRINKEGKEYWIYERTQQDKCPHLNQENLIIDVCKKCGKKSCNCEYQKKEKKGQAYGKKTKISTKDICQLPRGSFKKKVNNGQSEHQRNN